MKFLRRFVCRIFGHSDRRVVEEYSRNERMESYLVVCGRVVHMPHIAADIHCKWRCGFCGEFGIGTLKLGRRPR